jgi:hypothetical protein
MFKIEELEVVPVNKSSTSTQEYYDILRFIKLPLDFDKVFVKLDGYWYEHKNPAICYDDNGLPHLEVQRSKDKDIPIGITRKVSNENKNKASSKDNV